MNVQEDNKIEHQNKENGQEETQEGVKIIDTAERVEVAIEPQTKKQKSFIKEIMSYVLIIAVAYFAAQLIHRYLFTPVTVDGDSMNPNLENSDVLYLSRRGSIERLDVVVFEAPGEDYYIKRVIGLPGDTLTYVDRELYINGVKFDEPYADKTKSENPWVHQYTYDFTMNQICNIPTHVVNCETDNGEYKIPEGYYFVMGDNRSHSNDSRMLGLISEEKLIGEAKFILYPFSRFGKINNK